MKREERDTDWVDIRRRCKITGSVNIRRRAGEKRRRQKRRGARRQRGGLFSLLERFNQVHISALNHKGPPLVCGSQRTSWGFAAQTAAIREQPENILNSQLTTAEPMPPLSRLVHCHYPHSLFLSVYRVIMVIIIIYSRTINIWYLSKRSNKKDFWNSFS